MIVDNCPNCKREFPWNSEGDFYEAAKEHNHPLGERVEIVIHACPDCDATIAITMNDEFGSTVYIPSTKPL